MNTENIGTIEQIEKLLSATEDLSVSFETKKELYDAVRGILIRTKYLALPKKQKGIVKKFILQITGYSQKQVKRLIATHKKGKLVWKPWQKNPFHQIYTQGDIALLHHVDSIHQCLSGPATRKILEMEFLSGKIDYERISQISPSHIYNLRHSVSYERRGHIFHKTIPTGRTIGIRTKPQPFGRPGFLRVDSVHQGDLNGQKGLYWINFVDEVTQFQFVFPVVSLEHKYIIRILDLLFWICPFEIINFHSDNGSEYINQYIATVLNKRNIRQTKSRPRRHNDNGLVESKNGSVIRKYFGRNHIPATEKNTKLLSQFCIDWFIPYINFYRPSSFHIDSIDSKGKIRKKYPHDLFITPYEKLKSLPDSNTYLQTSVAFSDLDKTYLHSSPSDFAFLMNQQKDIIFSKIFS